MNLSELRNGSKEDITNDTISELAEVTPEEMGYKPKEVEPVDNRDDLDKALDKFEQEILPKKVREMQIVNDLIEENDGNVSKQQINEALGLGFVNDVLYKDEPPIPLNIKAMKQVEQARKKKNIKLEDEEDEDYNDMITGNNDNIDLNFVDEEEEEEDDLDDVYVGYDNDNVGYDNNAKLLINDSANVAYNSKVSIDKPIHEPVVPEETKEVVPEEKKDDDLKDIMKPKTNIDADKILAFDSANKEDDYSLPTNLDDIEFPDDEDEDDDNQETTSQADRDSEEINTKLREAVRSKIKPVAKKYDLSAFTISKKPIALNSIMDNVESPNRKAADWVAYNTGHKFRMLGFTGAELDKLNNPNSGDRLRNESIKYKMIYDHIIDKDKPDTMEQWAKITSFFDIEHYWFGAFRATFEGAAFIPVTNCPTDNKHIFLTDNMDIMSFVKFNKDESRDRFYKIYHREIDENKSLYKTDLVPISENFAVSFREPSIYNMIFEIANLDQQFVDKYRDVIALITYIDEIYYINKATMQLVPINYKHYPNNIAKTTKSKIIQYGKTIRKMSSDQYHALLMYIQEITNNSDDITYQIPEITCEECGTVIPAYDISGNDLVFTRHQLAALAVL